jgi:hypothetical protein
MPILQITTEFTTKRRSRLERFCQSRKKIVLFSKGTWLPYSTRGVVNFYKSGSVTHDRSTGSWYYFQSDWKWQKVFTYNVWSFISRVTRLGEFSPIRKLFTLGIFLIIMYICSAKFWARYFFLKVKAMYYFWLKWFWLYFGLLLSEAHLVTLFISLKLRHEPRTFCSWRGGNATKQGFMLIDAKIERTLHTLPHENFILKFFVILTKLCTYPSMYVIPKKLSYSDGDTQFFYSFEPSHRDFRPSNDL